MPRRHRSLRRRPIARKPRTEASDAIERINDLTQVGKTNWFGLLAYLVFAFVTLLGVEDADFFVASRETTLPLIGVDIPTTSFFLFAPALGTALYVYLHLHIRKVIDALTDPELQTPGAPLERQITPWLLNDLILLRQNKGMIEKRPMDWLVKWTGFTLIWLIGPIVQASFWIRSAPANDEWMTMFLGVCLCLCIYAGLRSWLLLRHRVRKSQEKPYARTLLRLGFACLLPVILFQSWVVTEGGLENYLDIADDSWLSSDPKKSSLFPGADLRGVTFSSFPPEAIDERIARHRHRVTWCERSAIPIAVCGRYVDGTDEPTIGQMIQRENWCKGTVENCTAFFAAKDEEFLNEWRDLRAAQRDALPKPDFANADLRFARLNGASLVGVNMGSALLTRTDLSDANLEGATLRRAKILGTNFSNATLKDADLTGFFAVGSNFVGTDFSGAVFWRGELLVSAFVESILHDADLTGAIGADNFLLQRSIGNENTRLPAASPPLRIPAYWAEETSTWALLRSTLDWQPGKDLHLGNTKERLLSSHRNRSGPQFHTGPTQLRAQGL